MTEHKMNKNAIVSLAILKTNYDTKEIDGKRVGYLENFVLLVVNLAYRKKYDSIKMDDLENLQKDFLEHYGFKLPVMILRTILSKAKRLGFFVLEHRELKPIESKIAEVVSKESASDSRREINYLLASMKEFAKKRYGKKVLNEDLEEGLIGILGRHSLDILYFYENEDFKTKNLLPGISKKNPTIEYVIYKYIEKIEKGDPVTYAIFEKISVGYALLNAVVYAGEDFQKGTIQKINIFLDTRPILRILGIEGDEQKNNYLEFLEYIEKHSKGIQLYILDKHYDEILHIFEQAKAIIDSGSIDYERISMATRYFIDNQNTSSDIEEFIGLLEEKLNHFGIREYTKFDYLKSSFEFQVDESELEKKIAEMYKKYDFRFILTKSKEESIAVDASMIAQVMTLKENKICRNFSDIKYLFITSNIGLALASKYFEKEEFDLEASFIPTCVTDFFFFTLLWANNGGGQLNNDQRIDTKIITRTLLAFNPDKKLYEKYYQELKKLKDREKITSEEYALLCSRQAMESMEERTLSDYEAINSKLPFEIMEEINSKAHKKYLEEKDEHVSTKLKLEKEYAVQDIKVENISKGIHSAIEILLMILGMFYLYYSLDSIVAMVQNKMPSVSGSIYVLVVGFLGYSIFDFFKSNSIILEKIQNFVRNFLYGK